MSAAPVEIRLSADKTALTVAFDDGAAFALEAELLRTHSPSAEVQGHTPLERKLVSGKRGVKIARLDPVGHYAVRIVFDDSHDSGLFTWGYLRELGEGREDKWRAYLAELAAKGFTRG
ncbi:MAG: DUF971 domain-containing protein [Hyphomicrobiales bacterium]|nr:DUF971 domain-containing protein [Hyphomicrobiales bacterium]